MTKAIDDYMSRLGDSAELIGITPTVVGRMEFAVKLAIKEGLASEVSSLVLTNALAQRKRMDENGDEVDESYSAIRSLWLMGDKGVMEFREITSKGRLNFDLLRDCSSIWFDIDLIGATFSPDSDLESQLQEDSRINIRVKFSESLDGAFSGYTKANCAAVWNFVKSNFVS